MHGSSIPPEGVQTNKNTSAFFPSHILHPISHHTHMATGITAGTFHTHFHTGDGVFPLLKVRSMSSKSQVFNQCLHYCARHGGMSSHCTPIVYKATEPPHGKQAPHTSFHGATVQHRTCTPNLKGHSEVRHLG